MSIEVAETVRDRLAVLAAEKGTTMARLVGDLAARTPTKSERAALTARAPSGPGLPEKPEKPDGEADAELIRRIGDCVVSVGVQAGFLPPGW
ncbi:hypothetical protein [Streptomyces mobaraensis]|uniref:hypothetical protein n=2 Tax=Streptomyces TaxID=1883 RepID=UPI001CCB23FF|nr:hypothetical protein [Streptomyces mobaraensis]UBI37650.1 hypothetical protein K7I03_15005 [Streptomyces mobaraensis]